MQRLDDQHETVNPAAAEDLEQAPPPAIPAFEADAGAEDERGFAVHDRRFWAREAAEAEADAAEAPAHRKPSYVEDLERQLAEKDERLKQYIEAHRQAQRQFDEVRERLQRDVQRQVEQSRADLIARFFPVLDDMDRSLEAAAQSGGLEALRDGVRIVHREFLDTLAALGLERDDPLGEPFDPNLHDALSLVPVTDPAQDNRVQQVFRCGYRAGDRVLRHAVVLVGRHLSQPATDTTALASEE